MAKSNENLNNLLQLIKENPDLPIVPAVDSEICWGDYARYIGNWGCAYIDEYLIAKTYDERLLYKSDNDIYDTLERYLTTEEFENLPESDEKCEEIYRNLPWKKVIFVNIDTMEA